jgi:hypothetical protein
MQTSSCEASPLSPKVSRQNRKAKLTVPNQQDIAHPEIDAQLATRLPFSRAKFRNEKGQEKARPGKKKDPEVVYDSHSDARHVCNISRDRLSEKRQGRNKGHRSRRGSPPGFSSFAAKIYRWF